MPLNRPNPAPDPFGESEGDERAGHGPLSGADVPGRAGHEAPGGFRPMVPPGRLNLLLSYAPWHTHAWAEHLPRFLEPMGVVASRVSSAREAERFVRSQTVHIAVVDLSLPLEDTTPAEAAEAEEAGARVLELLGRLQSPPPTVVVRPPRLQRDGRRDLNAALRCGAFAVVDRTAADLEMMLQLMQRCLHRHYQGRWPGC